jgi:hypothetical protein
MRIRCACGEMLADQLVPNPIGWLLTSESAFEAFAGKVDAEDVYVSMEKALKCPTCGRLWIFWEKTSRWPQEYVPVERRDGSAEE